MRLSRPWRLLLLPLAAGAALRLHQAWSYGGHYMPHQDREEGYYETALSALGAGSFGLIPNTAPSAFHAPVYPSWIALTQAPFPRSSPRWTRWAQALLSTLAIAVCFALAARVASLEAGAWAAWLCALDPLQIAEVGGLNVHAFYGFMVLALAAGLALWLEKRSPRLSLLAALLLAASLLTRSAHYPLPLLWLAALAAWRLPGQAWRAAALTAAFTALFLAPALARNWLQFDRFILLDAHKGAYVLLRSTDGPYFNTTVEEALEVAEKIEPGFAARGLQGEALFDELLRLAVKNALAHPAAYAGYCLRRLAHFWSGLWALGLLSAAGLWLWRGRRGLQAVAVAAASFCGYGLAGGAVEYRVSVTPLLCVLAGAGAAALLARAARRAAPQPARAHSWALVAGLAVAGVSYAAMLAFTGVELALHPQWRGERPARPLGDRVLGVLEDAATRMGPRGVAASIYAEVLLREAWLANEGGQDARSKELLTRLARLPPLPPARDGDGARELLERASIHRRLRGHEEAEKALRAALKRRPRERRTLAALLTLLCELERDEEALSVAQELERASLKPGERAEARARLGEVLRLLERRAEGLARRGRLESARALADRAVAAAPAGEPRVRALALRASLSWRGGALARAEEDLARALDARPPGALDDGTLAEIRALRALARGSLSAEGRAELSRAVLAQPARVCRALPGFVNRGRLDLAYFDFCLERFPGDAPLLSDRGVARFLKGDHSGAQSDLRAALRSEPGRAEAAVSLATVLCAQGLPGPARNALSQALASRLTGGVEARRRAAQLAAALRGGTCPP